MPRRDRRKREHLGAAMALAAVVGLGESAAFGQAGLWMAMQPARVERVECLAREMTMPLDALRPARAVMFRVGEAAGRDRVCAVRMDDDASAVLAVDRPGVVLAGETVGYVWVRPVGAGSARLRVGDDSVLIHVVAGDDTIAARALAPRVLSPSAGAAVWGTVQVSVRVWREQGTAGDGATVGLIVPDGSGGERRVEPVWSNSIESGPVALASFAVDFDALPAGECSIVAVRTLTDGTELRSTPAVVRIVREEESDLIAGECEADYGLMGQRQVGPPVAPRSERDATASGGRYFSNASAEPRFRFPVSVPSERGAGWYQVMVTASGDAAAGALPAIGLRIDEAERLTIAGQIAQPKWHRAAIGTPIRLEPGLRVLRCDYANDFQTRGVDRNLRMDKIEVLRVADVDVREGGSADSSAMMANETSGDAMKPMMDEGGATMAGGASAYGAGGAWPALANAAVRPPVRIAFERPLDGLWVQGEAEVRGVLWFEGQGARTPRTPPQVELVINDVVIDVQRSESPRFTVPPESWRAGANSVRLRAIGTGGWTAETVEQVVMRESTADHAARASTRITIHEPGWFGLRRGQWKDNQGGEGRWSAPLAASSQVLLELPEHLSGEFDLLVECRAGAGGQAMSFGVIEGALDGTNLPPTPVETARHDVPTWFGTHRATDRTKRGVLLGEGKKTLVIAVPPRTGRWENGKGDKNAVWVQAVRLVQRPESRDVAGPTTTVLYPSEGTEMHEADAFIVRAADGSETVRSAELVIDGAPTGMVFDVAKLNGFGDIVLPVILRGVSEGEHTLAAKISDDAGNVTVTESRRVRVLGTAPEGGTTYRRTIAALDRFAFGPDQRELAAALELGVRGYLEDRLGLAPSPRDDSAADPALALAEARFPNHRSTSDVTRRALQQAIASGNPVRARFTLWAENHFSTWIRKDEPYRKADEHERFSTLGIARFHDLLRASATSPAMLRYLDQERSFAGRLNENYAREILELHTLGVHGGYSQQDVTNLAHVLTGWTTARQALGALPTASPDEDVLIDEFSYEPAGAASLREPRTVLGCRFGESATEQRHERVLRALEVLDAHPSTARFVCEKIVSHYLGAPADERVVEDLASVFARTGGDMREVLLALAEHPGFADATIERTRLAHPLDYGVRLCRVAKWNAPWDVGDAMGASGQGLFDRPTPDGYPEADSEAMDSNTLLQRWRLASRADNAIADLVPNAMRWTDRPIGDAEAQRIIDIIAVRLTGRTLGAASNATAMEMLSATAPPLPAKPEDLARDGRIRTVGAFIAQLPEAGVR